MKKPKSFVYNFAFVGIIFLFIGLVLLAIALFMQLIPIDYRSLNIRINGVRQEPSPEALKSYRLLFLSIFGMIGGVFTVVGGVIVGRKVHMKKKVERLKIEGTRVKAVVSGFNASGVRVNNRSTVRMQCAYTDFMEKTYIFTSGILRVDPTPYLKNGEVYVYYEKGNMKSYFVDVDGSVGLGTDVFEL